MKLVVITSSQDRFPPQADPSWVLRLSGIPTPSETPPPDALELADRAAARVRAAFPKWLWQWVNDHGALGLEYWPGPISWWWYSPLSEMSPMRAPFIREIYWLTLFDSLLERGVVKSVDWLGDDPLIAQAAARVAGMRQIPFAMTLRAGSRKNSPSYIHLRRLVYSCRQLMVWMLLRILGCAKRKPSANPDIALATRYPVLWEEFHERMYGTWPDYLQTNRHDLLFGASYTGNALNLLFSWKKTIDFCRLKKLVFVESLVPLKTFLAAHFPSGFFRKLRDWQAPIRNQPVVYDGFEVGDLWWRQWEADVYSLELPFDRVLSEGWHLLLREFPSVRTVFHPFEFQPMERAIGCGAKRNRQTRIVGVQTGLYCANQMGFSFLPESIRKEAHQATHAPLPDDLAAYGNLPYKVFADRLGFRHVFNSGPLRYSVNDKTPDPVGFRKENGLPDNKTFVLLATPAIREEALRVLEGALRVLQSRSDVFLLAKFHYHRPLHRELKSRAQAAGFSGRIKVFDSDLNTLMSLSALMMTGGSSTGIEAMAQRCMPVVYRPIGEMPCNPMMDIPEAAFFWSTFEELDQAVTACLEKSNAYEQRRQAWSRALDAHMSAPGVSPNERLYTSLGNLSMISL